MNTQVTTNSLELDGWRTLKQGFYFGLGFFLAVCTLSVLAAVTLAAIPDENQKTERQQTFADSAEVDPFVTNRDLTEEELKLRKELPRLLQPKS